MDFWIVCESEIIVVEWGKKGVCVMILKASYYSFNLDGLWC